MQYNAKSPEEYLSQLESDWRKETLLSVRKLLHEAHDFEEGIQYKMLSFGIGEKILFHLNAQANYVSLYVGNIEKVKGGRDLLHGFDLGKGCIRIKKSMHLKTTQLTDFINAAKNLWLQGEDLDC